MQKRLLYHIAFWTGYVLFKSYLNFESDNENPTVRVLLVSIAAQVALLIVKVPMVYSLFYIVEKYLAKQWSIAKTGITVAALFMVSVAVFFPVKQYIVLDLIYERKSRLLQAVNFSSVFYTFFLLGFTCSVAVAIKLMRSSIRQREIKREIIKTKLETELQFLKAQMNPHFLFNTLNNIYALARKKSDDTAAVVVKLSKLLRFILYESQKQFIPIIDEIHVLDDYIELEKIRYYGKLKVNFFLSIDNESQPVAPFILLPFIENAFKHGASESRFNSYIDIKLQLERGQLYFNSRNSKADKVMKNEMGKIGLGNIRRQLELLYPGHTLEINDAELFFEVLLKIDLNKQTQLIKPAAQSRAGMGSL